MDAITDSLLKDIAQRIASEIKPDKIFLFGSRAWGTPTIDSDVDLMIVVSGEQDSIRTLKQRARRCLHDIFIPMDIVIEPVDLFERRCTVYASLERQVLEKGIPLYG